MDTVYHTLKDAANVIGYWLKLAAYSLFFAVLAVIFLEFIDKDKR